ncbi:MAG: hypothetical protein KDD51_00720 [Bdellovibrionales bacterium]|nr:hypothetical protein [Bdellovibrionales bacterium]
MKSVFWGLLLITCCVNANAAWKTSTCKDAEFAQTAWRDITTVEPRIQQHLDFIAKESGDVTGTTVNLTNCHVQLPIDTQGKTTDGDRVVTMDKVWETHTNGRYEKHIAGMRIVFSERIRTRIPRKEWVLTPEGYYIEQTIYVEQIGRRVQGFSICAGNSCDSLEIPYAGAVGMGGGTPTSAELPILAPGATRK